MHLIDKYVRDQISEELNSIEFENQFIHRMINYLLKDENKELLSKFSLVLNSSENFLTSEQTCKYLNVSRTTLYNYTKAGILTCHRLNRRTLYSQSEIIEKLKSIKSYKKNL